MRRKILFLWFMYICIASSVNSQQVDREEKRRFVVVPAEQVLVSIVYQPDCHLQFEEAKVLAAMDGSETSGYAVRNKGTKPIRSFTVGVPGGTVTWSEAFTKKLFMPGEKTPGNADLEIVPLSAELRNKLNLIGPMRGVAVFMVIQVEYADGSIYSAESTYKALQEYGRELVELKANVKSQ